MRGPFARTMTDMRFWFVTRVATAVTRYWSGLLWIAAFLVCALLVSIIFILLPQWGALDKIQYVGLVLAVTFGLFTVISCLISIAVLHSLRDLIPDYTHAGPIFKKIIANTRHSLFILTENPAFLQVFDPSALKEWLGELEKQIGDRGIRVIITYINRSVLVEEKFISWAKALRVSPATLRGKLLTDYTFCTAKKADYRDSISLIPLNTQSIPFYIAIADDRMAMFCHSTIYPVSESVSFKMTEQSLENLKSTEIPNDILEKLKNMTNQDAMKKKNFLDSLKATIGDEQIDEHRLSILDQTLILKDTIDVRRSVLSGFLTYDPNIVLALKSVYLKFFQLKASVYEYRCESCQHTTHKFDHDLLGVERGFTFTSNNLSTIPKLRCEKPRCNGVMKGEFKELISLAEDVRNKLYEKVTKEEWQD